MSNPFADGSIVLEGETSDSTTYLQFDPNGLPGDFWLHRRDEFDPTATREEILDRYALPESEAYSVRVVEVPPGVAIRFGTIGANHGRPGGGDLMDPLEYDTIPTDWIRKTTSLDDFIDG